MISFCNPDGRYGEREALASALRAVRSALRGVGRLLPLLCLLTPCALGGYFLSRYAVARYHAQAAQADLQQHDFLRAQDHLKRALAIRDDPATTFLAARTARRAGNFDEAVNRLSDCEKQQGTTPAILLEQLLLRAQRGDLTTELEQRLWSLVHHHHPDTPLILEAMTQGCIYTYRLPDARVCLERWLEEQPDCVAALLWRAQVFETLHSRDEALDDYRRAVALDPADDSARVRLAMFLAFSGRTDQAVEHFEQLWPRQAQNPQVLLGLARCRISQGRTKEAEQLLDTLLHRTPQDIPGLRERGRVALHKGQLAEAENWLRKCLALDPHDQEALYLLVLCLGQLGKETEAQGYKVRLERIDADLKRLEALNRAVARVPGDASLRYEAALICLRYGQEQEGLRWLIGALQVNPDYQPAHQTLADCYERCGQTDRAAYHRRLASRSGPN